MLKSIDKDGNGRKGDAVLGKEQNCAAHLSSGENTPGKDTENSAGRTAYKSIEHIALQYSALETRKITDEMPGGFFIYRADEEAKIIYANKAMVRLFNCQTLEEFQEWTGNSFLGIVHPEDLDRVQESIKEQIEASQYDLDYVEYRIIQKGGIIRWVEDYGHFIHSDFAGDVFYVFVGDATEKYRRRQEEKDALLLERKQEERKLRSQIDAYDKRLELSHQEQLRRMELIEGLSIDYESIFYVDFEACIFQTYRLSRRICDRFRQHHQEYSFGEFAGFSSDYIGRWVHPEDQELFLRAVDCGYVRKELSRQKVYHVNYRIVNGEKTEYLQLCVVSVGNGANGSQVVIGCRNIDDVIRREMEQNRVLGEALEQTKISNMVKDIFLANMSHDIRTPMNAIVGFTALAKMHMDDRQRLSDYLSKIQTASSQLLHLLDDVLELSRLEANKIQMEETVCNLHEVALRVQDIMQPEAEAKGLAFSLDLHKLVHSDVHGNRDYLVQLLLRLVSNAVKYTETGGSVAISVIEQKVSHGFATYQFIVEDTGIGISESFMEHIFEPFEWQKNTTMSGVQGTGLGLAIAKSVVEMMGGTIDAASVPGQGSRFTITLSLRLQSEAAGNREEKSEKALLQTPGRVLLVEDNEINLEIEVEILTDFGFLVDTATDGSIAVEKVKNSRPGDYDLILMDIQMPVMDGYAATRAIRQLENQELAAIPIVALSANAFEEDRKKSMECGMNAHMAKPIHIPQFLQVVEDMSGHVVQLRD